MIELPDFVREALEDGAAPVSEREALEALAGFSSLLDRATVPNRAWQRLELTTSRGALRYAPFFDELGEMFALDEPALSRELERAAAEKSAWSLTPFRGVRLFRVRAGAALGSAEGYLVRLSPSARIPRHRHPGEEVTFVLEGGYRDDSGQEVHAGELVRAASDDSFHSLRVIGGSPCVIALRLERRFVFESAFYRAFLALFWK